MITHHIAAYLSHPVVLVNCTNEYISMRLAQPLPPPLANAVTKDFTDTSLRDERRLEVVHIGPVRVMTVLDRPAGTVERDPLHCEHRTAFIDVE